MFDFKLFQSCQSSMKNRWFTITAALIQVVATNRAKAQARFLTQGLLRQSHDDFLSKIRLQINFVPRKWNQVDFISLDFNFLSERDLFNAVAISITKRNRNLQLTDYWRQAPATWRGYRRRQMTGHLNDLPRPGYLKSAVNRFIESDCPLFDEIL